MITVTGEALIDLVIDGDGRSQPRPGGGPFNTARTIGRLGRGTQNTLKYRIHTRANSPFIVGGGPSVV